MTTVGPAGPDEIGPASIAEGAEGRGTAAIVGRVARLGAWNMLAYVVQAGAALVINVVVGRLLGPADFGRYSYFVWIVRTLAWLFVLGIPPAMGRRISESQGAGEQAAIRATYSFSFKAMSAAMPFLFAATALWVWTRTADPLVSFELASAAVLLALVWGFEQAIGGLRRYDRVAKVAVVVACSQLVTLALVARTDPGLGPFIHLYAFIAASTFVCWWVMARRTMKQIPKGAHPKVEARPFMKLAAAMAAVTISDTFLWGRPEIYFLQEFRSETEVGLYAAALVLWTLTVYPPWIASRVLTPEFAFLRGGGRQDELARSFASVCTYVALVSLPLGIGAAIFASDLLLVAYGPSFVGASVAASILLAGSSFAAIMGPASSAALTGPRPSFAAKVSFSMAIANLGLDLLLVPPFGMIGAALATITSQSIAVLIIIVHVKIKMGLAYPWVRIAGIAAASGAAAGLSRLLSQPISNRTLALVVMVPATLAIYLAIVFTTRIVLVSDVKKVLSRS